MSSSSGSNSKDLNQATLNLVRKQLKDWREKTPTGFKLKSLSSNLQRLEIEVQGAQGTLYAGETYQIEVEIPQNYPYEAPQVNFKYLGPDHPQVYNDGHICLDELYDNWTSDMTLSSICVSIFKMLSTASVKKMPKDNQKCPHGRSNSLTNRRRTL